MLYILPPPRNSSPPSPWDSILYGSVSGDSAPNRENTANIIKIERKAGKRLSKIAKSIISKIGVSYYWFRRARLCNYRNWNQCSWRSDVESNYLQACYRFYIVSNTHYLNRILAGIRLIQLCLYLACIATLCCSFSRQAKKTPKHIWSDIRITVLFLNQRPNRNNHISPQGFVKKLFVAAKYRMIQLLQLIFQGVKQNTVQTRLS